MTRLSNDILDAWRLAAATIGAGLPTALGPGLSATEIDELAQRLRFQPPPEAVTLWAWGTAPGDTGEVSLDLHPAAELLAPAEAVDHTIALRREYPGWQDNWLFLLWRGGPLSGLVIDCNDRSAESAVFRFEGEDSSGLIAVAPSVGDLVVHWTQQIRSGEVYCDDGYLIPTAKAGSPWIR